MVEVKIKIIYNKENTIQFIIENITAEKLAEFRKIIENEIPTMAFKIVTIYENTTEYLDHQLVTQIYNIPLNSKNQSKYPLNSDADINKVNTKNSIKYNINFHCSKTNCTLTTDDIIPNINTTILPAYKMDIITFSKGGNIKADIYAVRGKGKIFKSVYDEGNYFIPIPLVSSKTPQDIVVTKKLWNGRVELLTIKTKEEIMKMGNILSVNYNTKEFLYTLSSRGQLPVMTILKYGIEIFTTKYNDYNFTITK